MERDDTRGTPLPPASAVSMQRTAAVSSELTTHTFRAAPFAGEETEAQRSRVACAEAQRYQVLELGLELALLSLPSPGVGSRSGRPLERQLTCCFGGG